MSAKRVLTPMFRVFLVALLILSPAIAQRPALNSPVIRFSDANGKPLVNGKLFSYSAGTSTPLPTYVDSTTGALNQNPVILDSTGSATVFLGANVYKFVLQNSSGVVQWTEDNVAQGMFQTSFVSSVFGRTGVVTARTGDYSCTQITGAICSLPTPPALFNQTVQVNGAAAVQRPILNFIPGVAGSIYTFTASGGTGYTGSPSVFFTGGGCSVEPTGSVAVSAGAVVNPTITTSGSGCTTAPTPSFSGGGGTGATGSTTLTPDGISCSDNPGHASTDCTFTLGSGGGGSSACVLTDVTSSRSIGATYQNTTTNLMFVSGTVNTFGSSVGTVYISEGAVSPNVQVFGNTWTATIDAGDAGFYAAILPGYFYQLTTSTGTFQNGISHWTEVTGCGGSGGGGGGAPSGVAGGVLNGTYPNPGLAPTGVTAGAYTNLNATVGADGRISAVSSGVGGAGSMSGQTATYLPKAATATTSTISSIIEDQGTGVVIHGTSPSHGITLPEGAPLAPVAGNAVIATDSTIHRATLSNNGAAASPVGTLADYAAPPAIGSVAPNTVTGRTLMQRGSQADCVGPGLFGANDCGGTYLLDDGTAATGSGTAVTNWDFNMFAWGPGGKGIAEGRTTAVFADNGVLATPGIKNVYQSATSMFGAGDVLFENKAYICNSGVAYTSDQGCQGEWLNVGQGESRGIGNPGYFIANLATGGVGTQSPTFDSNSIHGCTSPLNQACVPSPVSNLLDMTTPLATGFLNSPSVPFTGVPQPWLNQIPTTGGLPIATAWGYKMGVNLAPNTPWNLPNSQTFTLQAGAGTFAAGDLACVIGSGYPSFEEQSIITAVSGSSPTQAITLPLSRPEVNVSIFKGGCHFVSFNADAALGTRTAYPGVSIDGTNLIYAIPGYSQTQGTMTLPLAGAEPETTTGSTDPNSGFVLYCGARVNEDTAIPYHQAPTVQLEPNGCTWPAGGVVEDPDFPLQKVDGIEMTANQNNPAAPNAYMVAGYFAIKGMGATTASSVLSLTNQFSPDCSAYSAWSCGGRLTPPHLMPVKGIFFDDFLLNYAPSDSVIAIQSHLPGQTSYKLLNDPWGQIVISNGLVDFVTSSIHSAAVNTGTINSMAVHSVTNGGPPSDFGTNACCDTKPSINAYAWNNKPAYSLQNAANTASFGMFTVNAATNNPAIGTAPGNALGSLDVTTLSAGNQNLKLTPVPWAAGYNLLEFNGVTTVDGVLGIDGGGPGDPRMYLQVPIGGEFALQVNAADAGIVSATGWKLASGQVLQLTGDTGLSRDSAGVVDIGNGVAGNKSGSMNLTNLTVTGTCTGCGGGGGAVSSLTTTGTSGAATLAAGVLNIPNYAGGGGVMVYPAAGIPSSNGTGWLASYGVSGTGNVALTASPTFTGTVTAAALADSALTPGTCIQVGTGGLLSSTNGNCYSLGGTLNQSQPCANLVFGPGAGTGATCVSLVGFDGSHAVSITTGTAPSTISQIFQMNFTASRGHNTYCVITPDFSQYTTFDQVPYLFFSSGLTTSYAIKSRATALAASTSYSFNVACP